MDRRVVIDMGPPCTRRFGADDAVVVVDVIRATTTAVTVLAEGGRCLPVATREAAHARACTLARPLLAGEIGGVRPYEFDLQNSPAAMLQQADLQERPVILLSSSGTPLLYEVRAAGAATIYPACLRNRRAVAEHLAARHTQVTLMGAATRGEFREEDQLCCAFIAGWLAEAGFAVEDEATAAMIARWKGAPPDAFLGSESVNYLRRSGQLDDLELILAHVDDLEEVYELSGGEVVRVETTRGARRAVV